MNDSVDLSISIVNTSNWQFLQPCLESIYQNVKGISFEILVVDNASTDGSRDQIINHFPNVILTENEKRFGFAQNNNLNLEKASGRYLMLLNDDTLVLPDSLEKAIRYLDANPQVGMLGCEMVSPNGEYQVASARKNRTLLSEFLIETGINRKINYIDPTPKVGGEAVKIDLPSEAGMIVRREVYDQVGPLDDAFFMYGEGADWSFRIKKAGWKIGFLPGSKIIHYGDQTNRRVKQSMYLQFYKSTYLFIKKKNSSMGWLYRLFILIIFPIKKMVARITSVIKGGATREEAIRRIPYYDALIDLFSHRLSEESYPLPGISSELSSSEDRLKQRF